MIKIYVYQKDSKAFLYADTGMEDYVVNDLTENEDFTLTPPPDYEHTWRWIDSKWITDDTAN